MSTGEWTYEGYWHAVIGLHTPAQAVAEFDLTGEGGIERWLEEAETISAAQSADFSDDDAATWAAFRTRAASALSAALADAIGGA